MSAGVAALRGTPPEVRADGRADDAVTTVRRADGPDPERPLVAAYTARSITLVALVAYGALHWMQMLEPATPGKGWLTTAMAGVGCALFGLVRPLGPRARIALAIVVTLLMTALAFTIVGYPVRYLLPWHWDECAGAVGRGLDAIPGARVPYRGINPDMRLVLPLGGTVLGALATAVACWPRAKGKFGFRGGALILLLALYIVPVIALDFGSQFVRGALLALLILAFIGLDRVRRRDVPMAAALTGGALILGLMVAPGINRQDPWFDYEHWALSAASSKTTAFSWDHNYGPLDWPRDGREMLRVSAGQSAYWKAEDLDDFDGQHWVVGDQARRQPPVEQQVPINRTTRQWVQKIQVSVRNLRSTTFIGAGMTLDVNMPGRSPYPERAGIFTTTRELKRGDAYQATVYTPHPTADQLRDASSDYDESMRAYTSLNVPLATTTPPGAYPYERDAFVSFPFFDELGASPQVYSRDNYGDSGEQLLADSDLKRTYALSQKLRQGATTPYQYVHRVENYLSKGFTYSETPGPAAETLEGFLFKAKKGYCQQFSGAMAMLLRMAGIPARVAAGFAPGAYDDKTKQYVVRDLDAHSWVEVWFPDYGWITFDPTPSAAPPRSQAAITLPSAAAGDPRDIGTSDRRSDPTQGGGADYVNPDKGTHATPIFFAGFCLLVFGIPALAYLRRRLAARRPAAALPELERALRRANRIPTPGTTLASLEQSWAHAPPAASYIRAIRVARFSDDAEAPPANRTQRRSVRAELARGGGLRGRLRALWALPPRRA